MIQPYIFINGNVSGEKERKLSSTTELYNKLSAEETNNIRLKLNELVDGVNSFSVPLFPKLKLLYKASGNLNQLSFEIGDIVGGYNGEYYYNGGDVNNIVNYTKRPSIALDFSRFVPTGQVCALPIGAIAISATIDGYVQYPEQAGFETDLNTFTQTGNDVTFKTTIEIGSQILIQFYI